MKSIKQILPVMMALHNMGEEPDVDSVSQLSSEEVLEIRRKNWKRIEEIYVEKCRRQKFGLKEFVYYGKSIWARNKKNADRKARNKGYIG